MWPPYTQSSIHAVEMLQRKAARFVCNDFARLSSITSVLDHLGWNTLEQRRNQLTLLMLYKIINKFVEVPHHHILTASTRNSTSKYTHKLIHINSHFSLEPSDSGTLYQII